MSNLGLLWYCLLGSIQGSILPQKHNSKWTIIQSPPNQFKLHILSIGGDFATYIKFGLMLISFAWGFNSRFNFAAETLLLMNHKQTTLESIKTSYVVYWGWDRTIYEIGAYLDIGFLRFNSAANWSYKGLGTLT
jgi:hypothetical protein